LNTNFKFNPNVIGVKGYKLDLENIEILKIINTKYFLNNYKISNFLWGKWILKRLINRVFKRRINQKMIWNKSFWNKIEVILIKAEIPRNKFLDTQALEMKIKPEVKEKRFKDIKNYKKKLIEGNKFPPPLYISGKSLNFLGATIDKNSLYILDGSRRLTAHILNRINPEILILHIGKEND